jgi:hypothetical protein
MLSVLFATVGLPASWWVAPALLGAAIVGLLLHPMTRADFARRELAGSDVRAARVFWVDRDPEPNGGS